MPFDVAMAMRSSHCLIASGGCVCVVSASTIFVNDPGALSASVWPIMPPMDSPQ